MSKASLLTGDWLESERFRALPSDGELKRQDLLLQPRVVLDEKVRTSPLNPMRSHPGGRFPHFARPQPGDCRFYRASDDSDGSRRSHHPIGHLHVCQRIERRYHRLLEFGEVHRRRRRAHDRHLHLSRLQPSNPLHEPQFPGIAGSPGVQALFREKGWGTRYHPISRASRLNASPCRRGGKPTL